MSDAAGLPRACGGDPSSTRQSKPEASVFPAHAGVILPSPDRGWTFDGLPRACGGDPGHEAQCKFADGSSPRMRG